MTKAKEDYYSLLARCKEDEGVIENYVKELEVQLKNSNSHRDAHFKVCCQLQKNIKLEIDEIDELKEKNLKLKKEFCHMCKNYVRQSLDDCIN